MKNEKKSPFFSIVIATRDRAELFKIALDSIFSQDFTDFEIHVVNDGSTGKNIDLYKEIEKNYPEKVTFHYLTYRPSGHGHSYSVNFGAYYSQGEYLCFLDDDDYWIDSHHLSRAAKSISEAKKPIDLFYTNQKAYFSDGSRNEETLWLDNLEQFLLKSTQDEQGSYLVDLPLLLKVEGFAHINCSIISRDLFNNIKGLDEHIRYENDRDFYIRSIDLADNILYNPAFVSKHRIPDQKLANNLSTVISGLEKKIFQMRVYDKGIIQSKNQMLVELCKKGRGHELKYIAERLASTKQYSLAFYYARSALGAAPTIKWMLYTILLLIKSKLGHSQ